jgi:predicted dehydrogenase
MIQIGIAGMGGMGTFHAARFVQIPGVRVTAIADIRPERLAAKEPVVINIENKASMADLSQAQRYTSAKQMIAEADVDVIDICLPSYLHATYSIQALQAGRHVLCEKPMALSLTDADAMIAVSRSENRKLMVAQCIRFWPEYQYLKQTIQEGALGQLLSLNLFRIGGRPTGWGWEDWFLDPARSGGTLYDLHIHDVDFVNSLFGAPQRLQATGRKTSPQSSCEVIHAIYGYANGPQVSIHAGWSEVQIPFKAGYEAWFERGFLRLDPDRTPSLMIYTDATGQNGEPAMYQPGDAYLNEIRYFINCLKTSQDLAECPPESARDSLSLLVRERESIEAKEIA